MKVKNSDWPVTTFRCSKQLSEHLRNIVISIIRQTGRMYTLSALIRHTLEQMFPPPVIPAYPQKKKLENAYPNQLELFDDDIEKIILKACQDLENDINEMDKQVLDVEKYH